MKNIFVSFLVVILALGCAVAGRAVYDSSLGEVFEGTGQGYRGPITVQVRISEGSIIEIAVIDSEEDRFVGREAIEELIDLIVAYNTTDVDAISGATESSRGFLEAVENAIISP